MEIRYRSTRGGEGNVTASAAILKGLADDGGLFVPEQFPKLSISVEALAGLSYQETAYEVMKLYFTDFTEEELKSCIQKAYDDKFDNPQIAPLKKAGQVHYLELFHGATIAFKDMALSILPHLMTVSAKKNQLEEEIVILTATSGDTGKAAMAGFADVAGTRIIVFYPKDGVSPIQKKQMVTQKGENTCVVAIEGNFDDTQNGVKEIFSDKEFAKAMKARKLVFSSANSINIGRLIPQVAYYAYAYGQMLATGEIKAGEEINVVVPTGNFGNILAAYYAKEIGIPIKKFICASNENKVLFDFFETGVYDRNREFLLTSSPSMDILISSNLERLIYEIAGQDCETVAMMMRALSSDGKYEISSEMQAKLQNFYGGYATESENFAEIARVFKEDEYILDTHTGVAATVYQKYLAATKDQTKTVIVSTASPYKFVKNVLEAVGEAVAGEDEFVMVDQLHALTGVVVPEAVEEIRTAAVRHQAVYGKDEMKKAVKEILGM